MNKEEKNTIVILGGGLKKDKGKWRTTNYDEGDNFGISGDRIRVVAASYLYKDNNDLLFIVSGGQGQLKGVLGNLTIAEVIKNELIKLGVPAKKIIKEKKSGNTFQQLKELKKIIVKEKLDKITIISNKSHFPRIKAMINYNYELRKLNSMIKDGQIELKSAEKVVLKYEKKKYQKIISSVYNSKAMKERIKLEQEGVKQIKKGVYKFK